MKKPKRKDIIKKILELSGIDTYCKRDNPDYLTRTQLLELLTFIEIVQNEQIGDRTNEKQ